MSMKIPATSSVRVPATLWLVACSAVSQTTAPPRVPSSEVRLRKLPLSRMQVTKQHLQKRTDDILPQFPILPSTNPCFLKLITYATWKPSLYQQTANFPSRECKEFLTGLKLYISFGPLVKEQRQHNAVEKMFVWFPTGLQTSWLKHDVRVEEIL